jgi:hypothetical protein
MMSGITYKERAIRALKADTARGKQSIGTRGNWGRKAVRVDVPAQDGMCAIGVEKRRTIPARRNGGPPTMGWNQRDTHGYLASLTSTR